MRAPERPGGLLVTLDERPRAPAADGELLAALRARLRVARLRVLVVGEAKRGKSTLVNALLGRDVLPVGVTPLTALATTVTHGADEDAEVRFLDGGPDRPGRPVTTRWLLGQPPLGIAALTAVGVILTVLAVRTTASPRIFLVGLAAAATGYRMGMPRYPRSLR